MNKIKSILLAAALTLVAATGYSQSVNTLAANPALGDIPTILDAVTVGNTVFVSVQVTGIGTWELQGNFAQYPVAPGIDPRFVPVAFGKDTASGRGVTVIPVPAGAYLGFSLVCFNTHGVAYVAYPIVPHPPRDY